jgi:hypothetical protein
MTDLSPAPPGIERAARVVAAVATVWFVVAISWGLFGRVAGGHEAVVGSRGIAADNMLAWHILGPVREYTVERPPPSQYYAHHPWGSFWTITAFASVLGRHAFVPRLVAVLTSAAVPPLLYGIGRALFGPIPGALAALAYTTLPMTLAFGNFPGFEVPLCTACLLTTWGYLRFAQTRKALWAGVSLLGVAWSVHCDWEANVFLGVAVGIGTVFAFFSDATPSRRAEARSFAQWASLSAVIALTTLLGYVVYFQSIEALGPLLAQGARRSGGNAHPLVGILLERRYWIDVTFTPLAVLVGKIALPIFLFRVFVLRRTLEAFAVALLVMAVVQYVQFKNGADVHIYWPYPFAPYYALSVAVIAHTAAAAARALSDVAGRPRWLARGPLVAVAAVALVPLVILPDGVTGLCYARMTGGRFNERGKPIYREEDKSQVLEWMATRLSDRGTVALHQSMRPSWAQAWALGRASDAVADLPLTHSPVEQRYLVADLDFLSSYEQAKLAQAFPLVVVGHYVLADRGALPAPVQAFRFDEREPTALEWYLRSGVDRVRTIQPDPFLTWELRAHYAEEPNPPPSGAPRSLEELRIAHNVAVDAGDAALALRDEHALVARLESGPATTYTDGTRLLGVAYQGGVAPTLTIFFLAVGPARADLQFEVTSTIDEAPRFSLVPRDERTKQLGSQFSLPSRLWKRGFIYAEECEIRHRPGRERFVGYFTGMNTEPPPRPADGSGPATVLALPR